MSKFTLNLIEEVKGKQIFEKLVIDNKCQFDEFEQKVCANKKYKIEIGKIYAYMEQVSNLMGLPNNKFKDITPDKEQVKEYEFKSKHLRVYAIKKKNGKIVILGGYKNNQKKEINKFRSIKRRYLESIK